MVRVSWLQAKLGIGTVNKIHESYSFIQQKYLVKIHLRIRIFLITHSLPYKNAFLQPNTCSRITIKNIKIISNISSELVVRTLELRHMFSVAFFQYLFQSIAVFK